MKKELHQWQTHQFKAETFKKTYPSFAPVLTSQMKIAEISMQESFRQKDQSVQLKKMSEANRLAEEIIRPFSELENSIEKLIDIVAELARLRLEARNETKIKALRFGENNVQDVRLILSKFTPSDLKAAQSILKQQVNTLNTAQISVNKTYLSLRHNHRKESGKIAPP